MKNLQHIVLILLYGGLVMQSFIVLANPMKVNRKANLFFGVFLFFWSCYWVLDILKISGLQVSEHFVLLVHCLQIFTPIFLYLSAAFYINPNYRFRLVNLISIVIPLVYFYLLTTYPEIADLLNISHNLLYISIVYFQVRIHQKRIESISSNKDGIDLQWMIKLLFLLFITIVITVAYEVYNAFIYKRPEHLAMDLLFLFIVYITSYYSLKQKEIYPINENERRELLLIESESEVGLDKKKLLLDDEFDFLKNKLIRVMDVEKPYLDGELNLIKLAGVMGISSHQLSYLINKGFNLNFFQFVNGYRVNRAKELLMDEKENKFSLVGIAFEAGFNSKTSFNTIFKKVTQKTPSEFRKTHSKL